MGKLRQGLLIHMVTNRPLGSLQFHPDFLHPCY